MASSPQDQAQQLLTWRREHPAWLVLAARRAPLVLSCLGPLLEQQQDSILLEDAQQQLAQMLRGFANDSEFDVGSDPSAQALRELRDWIRRGLIVEREGRLFATDALQMAMAFVSGLDQRVMTSSASRLATVQREIENLATALNPDQTARAEMIRRQIKNLERQLKAVEAGDIDVLSETAASEGIRDIYSLAMSLPADFRRVEDSYRTADRALRQSIISDEHHRGEIVDRLLDSHDALAETAEGQVFQGFYEQLNRSTELDQMRAQLKEILRNSATERALGRRQREDLRWLVNRLVSESRRVIEARARSEQDVRGFLKTGLAVEHHRVGQLLHALMERAVDIDWSNAALRRSATPLWPIAVDCSGVPVAERLRFKEVAEDAEDEFNLREQPADLNALDDEFWSSFDSLDIGQLQIETLAALEQTDAGLSLAELAEKLPPTHDLETLCCWLQWARDTGETVLTDREQFEIAGSDGEAMRFDTPRIKLHAEQFEAAVSRV